MRWALSFCTEYIHHFASGVKTQESRRVSSDNTLAARWLAAGAQPTVSRVQESRQTWAPLQGSNASHGYIVATNH